jgi:hypothetical protein
MVTISQIVRKKIEQKPFLQEALGAGIVNIAALAQQMIPEIEKETKKKVKFSAANMAIRRLAEDLEQTTAAKMRFKDSDVTMKSDLLEIVLYKKADIHDKIRELHHIVDFRRGDLLTITEGINEVMIITNIRYEKRIASLFTKSVKKTIRGLNSITLTLSEDAVNTLGLFYLATRALNWENINVIDIVSTYTEMTFIIKEEDGARAFETFQKLLASQRA